MGIFYPTISYKAVDDNTKAGLAQLEKINIRFRPNVLLTEAVNKAEKESVGVYKIVDYEKGFYQEVGRRELGDGSGNEGNTDKGDARWLQNKLGDGSGNEGNTDETPSGGTGGGNTDTGGGFAG